MSDSFDSLLRQERAAIEVYVDLLDSEAKAMSDGDFAGLPVLAERKSEVAETISRLGQQRELEQLALGYSAGRAGADAASAAGGPVLLQAWQDLLEWAAQAHQRNHRNGVMIHTHLDFTRQTIGFLQAGTGGQSLYGPDGSHKTGTGSGTSLARG